MQTGPVGNQATSAAQAPAPNPASSSISLSDLKQQLDSSYGAGSIISTQAYLLVSAQAGKGPVTLDMVSSALISAYGMSGQSLSASDAQLLAAQFMSLSGGGGQAPEYKIDYDAMNSWKAAYCQAMADAAKQMKKTSDVKDDRVTTDQLDQFKKRSDEIMQKEIKSLPPLFKGMDPQSPSVSSLTPHNVRDPKNRV